MLATDGIFLIFIAIFAFYWPAASIIVLCLFAFSLSVRFERLESLIKNLKVEKNPLNTQEIINTPLEPLNPNAFIESFETKPYTESFITKKIKTYLFEGNPIAKIGMLILFCGFAFLLKFASDHIHTPIVFRLIGVAFAAVCLICLGEKLIKKNRVYAMILQGGGFGVLYLTVYASFQYYHLLSASISLTLLFITTVLMASLGYRHNSKVLAILSILGGFIAPLIINTNSANYVLLFSYYALLNLSVIIFAWLKVWRELNLIGFIFTFILNTLWSYYQFQVLYYPFAQTFLILFFLVYISIPLIMVLRHHSITTLIDRLLIFGTPLAVFFLQVQMVDKIHFGAFKTAIVLAIFYTVLSFVLAQLKKPSINQFSEFYKTIAIFFASLAIPLHFTSLETSAIWALESAMLLSIDRRVNSGVMAYGAALLLFFSDLIFLMNPNVYDHSKILNEYYVSGCLIAIANFVSAYFYYLKSQKNVFPFLSFGLSFLMIAWGGWLSVNWQQIDVFVKPDKQILILLLVWGLSSLCAWQISEYTRWIYLRRSAYFLLPLMVILSLGTYFVNFYINSYTGLVWLFDACILFYFLYRDRQTVTQEARYCFSFLLGIWVLVTEINLFLFNHEYLFLVQTCLSICLTIFAVISTFLANRLRQRKLWFLGAGLIMFVIAKLFLIDLIDTNTLSRIITFIGVGILLLINGYISPLPPKD